ncbi:MAG: DUF58 domain-containing protein [bacterium]|nr:DUF58 domain-containing protein [bacterium]
MSVRETLRPETVRQLENIQLRARRVVEGFLTGLHKSPYHGFSAEFAQHRQYHPGDSMRAIDWKAYGRSDKLVVKEFQEETNLRTTIFLDCSGSMKFSSPAANGVTKFQYASDLAGALAFLMIHQRDAVGLVRCDTEIRESIPPRSLNSHLNVLLTSLENAEPGGETELGPQLHRVAEMIHRRGLVILISDLFDDPDAVLKGLAHFRHNGHEVLVFHILDPWELSFAFPKDGRFIDLETGEEILTRPRHVAGDVKRGVGDFFHKLQFEALARGIEIVQITTDIPYDTALLRYLARRSRLL